MSSGDIVLQFGLIDHQDADAAIAAASLADWVTLVREAARVLDPSALISVKLIGRKEGSLKQLLRIVEVNLAAVDEGSRDYPYLRKIAIGLSIASGSAFMGAGASQMLQPAVQKVEVVQVDHGPAVAEMLNRIASNPDVARAKRRFYRTVEQDRAITSVQIAEDFHAKPLAIVPRNQFAEQGGLWSAEEPAAPEEVRHATWTVVLVRAAFTPTPRAWTFLRDGLPFSAKMDDPAFLGAIAARTVPITLQEGVVMQIEVEYRERLIGQIWEYVDRSRRVARVISPRPLPSPATLAPPHAPEKQHQPR